MESKYTKDDLEQMQKLPLDVKIRMSQNRIKAWFDHHWNEGGYTYRLVEAKIQQC